MFEQYVAVTKRDAEFQGNPNDTRYIPMGARVLVLGEEMENGCIVVRYRGYNRVIKANTIQKERI